MELINYECPNYGNVAQPNNGQVVVIPEFQQSLSKYGVSLPYYLKENIHSLIFSYVY